MPEHRPIVKTKDLHGFRDGKIINGIQVTVTIPNERPFVNVEIAIHKDTIKSFKQEILLKHMMGKLDPDASPCDKILVSVMNKLKEQGY